MTDRGKKSLVGAFVLMSVAILIGTILMFGGGNLYGNSFRFVCYFTSSLSGLSVGSPVKLDGVSIGRVESVSIVSDPSTLKYSTPVIIEIDRESLFATEKITFFNQEDANEIMEKYVEKGLRAQLATVSLLTGQLGIELMFIGAKPRMHVVPEKHLEIDGLMQIPTVESKIEAIWNTIAELPLDDVVVKVDGLITQLTKTIEESNIPKLTAAYSNLAENLNTQVTGLGSLREELSTTIKTLDQTINSVNSLVVKNEKPVTDMIKSFTSTSKQVNQLIKDLNLLLQEDSATMLELAQTLEALQKASDAIAQLAGLLEIKPDSLIFGK